MDHLETVSETRIAPGSYSYVVDFFRRQGKPTSVPEQGDSFFDVTIIAELAKAYGYDNRFDALRGDKGLYDMALLITDYHCVMWRNMAPEVRHMLRLVHNTMCHHIIERGSKK